MEPTMAYDIKLDVSYARRPYIGSKVERARGRRHVAASSMGIACGSYFEVFLLL